MSLIQLILLLLLSSSFIFSREIDEREEMMEEEIEKRLAVQQKSMKKLYSTKRYLFIYLFIIKILLLLHDICGCG